jgi:hypothetical protein
MHPSLLAPALATSAALALACAHARSTGEPVAIPVSVSSQNRSSVDVYLMCGYGDAQWLGTVEGKHGGLFEIPVARARCGGGLHFFLVHLDWNKGFLGRTAPAPPALEDLSHDREVRPPVVGPGGERQLIGRARAV